jgi:hypothetical protein
VTGHCYFLGGHFLFTGEALFKWIRGRQFMSRSNNQRRKLKRVLAVGWISFLILAAIFFVFFFKNLQGKDGKIAISFTSPKYIYEVNSNLDINSLVVSYLSALVACDQNTLQSIVTDPSQFDDMTKWKERANRISGYQNVDCYTVPGLTEDTTIVYACSTLTIPGITSTPKDMMCFYVEEQDGTYRIVNSELSDEVTAYMESIDANEDIQELYQAVNEDIQRCLSEDQAFYDFYQDQIP